MASGYQFQSGAHNRYVDPAADGTRDGTSPTNDGPGVGPWTMAQALTAGSSAILDVWVRSGNYTIDATTVTLGAPNSGSLVSTRLLGYYVTPGDLVQPCSPNNPRILPSAGVTSGTLLTLSGSSHLAWANVDVDCANRGVNGISVANLTFVIVGARVAVGVFTGGIAGNPTGISGGNYFRCVVDRCQFIGGHTPISIDSPVFSTFVIGSNSAAQRCRASNCVLAGVSHAISPFQGGTANQCIARITGTNPAFQAAFGNLHSDSWSLYSDVLVAAGPTLLSDAVQDTYVMRRIRGVESVDASIQLPRASADVTQLAANPLPNWTHTTTPDLRLSAAGKRDLETLLLMRSLRDVPLPAGSLRDSVAELEGAIGRVVAPPPARIVHSIVT